MSRALRRSWEELPWSVTLWSQGNEKFGPTFIEIKPGTQSLPCFGSTSTGCDFSILDVLKSPRLHSEQLCIPSDSPSDDKRVYSVSTEGKKPSLLFYDRSEGSGGASAWLELRPLSDRSKLCGSGSWLGVAVQNAELDPTKYAGLMKAAGARITKISDNSPAEQARLRVGDIIGSFNGIDIETPQELASLVAQTPVGTRVPVGVWRSGRMVMLFVALGRKPDAEQRSSRVGPNISPAIGPSFDCNSARTPGQKLICSNPALSRTDLAYAQAYYALRQQLGPSAWQQLKVEAIQYENQALKNCGIPLDGPLPPDTATLAQCLQAAYQQQRSDWIARLKGPAAEEAGRAPESNIALQRRLQQLGFVPSDAAIDGIFGTGTRQAITAWQERNTREASGFISNQDASLIMDNAPPPDSASTSAAQLPEKPSSTPEQESKNGSVIAQWSGSTRMTTRPFHVDGPWELQWKPTGGFFALTLNRLGGTDELIANQTSNAESSSYVPERGDYYLKVEADAPWTVKAVRVAPLAGDSSNQSSTNSTEETDSSANTEHGATSSTRAGEMPEDERAMINAIYEAMKLYKFGRTEIQQGAARPARAQALCRLLPSRDARNWVGKIYKLSTNGEGRGVLEVQIAPDIYVETTNNALSDAFDHTLIDPQSTLFRALTQLQEGQKIQFSGSFLPSDTDCFRETSLTLNGSITEPAFLMRFRSVVPIMAAGESTH
jgi:uncharacterized protein